MDIKKIIIITIMIFSYGCSMKNTINSEKPLHAKKWKAVNSKKIIRRIK